MPSTSKTTSNSTSSNTVNPTQLAQFNQNYQNAQNNAASLQNPYTGQLVAGFTPEQLQAQQAMTNVGTNQAYTNNLTGATNSLQGILGNLPGGQINATPVNAATIANSDLSQYMNPYQNDVINSTMQQLGQQNANQLNQTNQGATAAGAFGGSRSGVADALTNQYNSQIAASTLAGLNSQNYNNAQSAAAQDAATQNAMGQFNAGQNMNAQQATFQNALSGAGTASGLAGQIGNLTNANAQMAQNQAGILGSVGSQQQQQQQNVDNANLSQAQYANQMTQAAQGMNNAALSMIPVEQTQNSNSTQTQTQNPGAMGIIGGLGSLAMAAAMPGVGSALGGLGSSLFGGGAASAIGSAGIPSFSSLPTMSLPSPSFTAFNGSGGAAGNGGFFGFG